MRPFSAYPNDPSFRLAVPEALEGFPKKMRWYPSFRRRILVGELTNMTVWFLLIGCFAMVSCAASQTHSQWETYTYQHLSTTIFIMQTFTTHILYHMKSSQEAISVIWKQKTETDDLRSVTTNMQSWELFLGWHSRATLLILNTS